MSESPETALAYIADELNTAQAHLNELADVVVAGRLGGAVVGIDDITHQLEQLSAYVQARRQQNRAVQP